MEINLLANFNFYLDEADSKKMNIFVPNLRGMPIQEIEQRPA
jgi:hypothetical protein